MAAKPEQQVEHIFQHLTRVLKDLSPALNELGEVAVAGIQENFRVGGRHGSGPFGGGTATGTWKVSARAKMQSGQTLIDTGLLSGSISYRIENNALVLSAGPRPGAALHNFGGTIVAKNAPFLVFQPYPKGPTVFRKRVVMPARPYMTLSDDDIQEMLDTLLDFYNQLIAG